MPLLWSENGVHLITGATTYTENFDGLGEVNQPWTDNSTLPGWVNKENQSGNVHTGTLTAAPGDQFGNIGNFGNSPDRALGWVPNSNDISPPPSLRISQYVYFQNNSGGDLTITELTLDFEQWRYTSSTTSGVFEFVYGTAANIGTLDSVFFGGGATRPPWVDDNQFDFTTFNASSPGYPGAPGPADGNDANNSLRGVTGTVGGGSGITLADGEVFAMGWFTGNAQNHAFAVDNISLIVVPEPSSLALLLAGAGALFVLRRNRKK